MEQGSEIFSNLLSAMRNQQIILFDGSKLISMPGPFMFFGWAGANRCQDKRG
jgi:hypothetical protein